MDILVIEQEFSICKINDIKAADFSDTYCFLGKTDEEISLVCRTSRVPDGATARDDGWRACRIQGVLDFSLVGILSKISGILANQDIGIYAVSTYNTDYILTKKDDFDRALSALADAGYRIIR